MKEEIEKKTKSIFLFIQLILSMKLLSAILETLKSSIKNLLLSTDKF